MPRIVIALGGNALLKRGEPMTTEAQRANVRLVAHALAPLYAGQEVVITHGNGPQVGLLALQDLAYDPTENAPLDVLDAQTEGSIGYMIEQELGNALPFEVPFATLLTMVEVDADDPAFKNPTKFVGPVYEKDEAERLAKANRWTIKQDGAKWRRVVPSPEPKRIFELRPIKWLLERGCIVICAGGGGIPTMYRPGAERELIGVEAVIDKDLCSALLAKELQADAYWVLTDAPGVYLDWGKPTQRLVRAANPAALKEIPFAAGSMGPKVAAACRFVDETGGTSMIGSLEDVQKMAVGTGGTRISRYVDGIVFA
jgi:carbamate kinase